MSIAVYAGTFDPPTDGHLSVIRGAARVFAHVRVLVAVNPDKQTLFSADEREALLRELTAAMPQVSIDQTSGLVVRYSQQIGASFLVRGVRCATDAEFETQLAHANKALAPDIATIFLPAEPSLSEVSSSELKRRAAAGDDVSSLCPAKVADALLRRLSRSATEQTHV